MPRWCLRCVLSRGKEETLGLAKLDRPSHGATADGSSGFILVAITKPTKEISVGQRTFAYDSLSRLLCAANPEAGSATCPNPDNGTYTAGTTRYGYDVNGKLISRIRPAPNNASGNVT